MVEVTEDSTKKQLMSLFWDLSSNDKAIRDQAALSLVEQVVELQQQQSMTADNGSTVHVDVEYALTRLVKGLASDRHGARQGYTVALTSILKQVTVIAISHAVELCNQHLATSASPGTQQSGSEQRGILFGRVFFCVSLIKSGRLTSAGSDGGDAHLQTVVSILLQAAKQKAFLRELVMMILLELCESVQGAGDLKAAVVKTCADQIQELKLNDTLEFGVLLMHLKAQVEMDDTWYQQLAALLKNSHEFSHPRLHSAWHLLLNNDAIVGDGKFSRFWTECVEENLFNSSVERMHVALSLFSVCLQMEIVHCESILTPNVVKTLFNSALNQKSALHKFAVLRCDELKQHLLTSYPGGPQKALAMFTECTKKISTNKCVQKVRSELTAASISVALPSAGDDGTEEQQQQQQQQKNEKDMLQYVHSIFKLFASCQSDDQQLLYLEQLVATVRDPKVEKSYEWLLEVVKFFSVHSLLKVSTAFQLDFDVVPLSGKVRDDMRAKLWNLLTFVGMIPNGKLNSEDGRSFVQDLLKFITTLDRKCKDSPPLAVECDAEVSALFKSAVKFILPQKASFACKSIANLVFYTAIQMRYSLIENEVGELAALLEDLMSVLRKVADCESINQADSMAINVLVDAMLSILSRMSDPEDQAVVEYKDMTTTSAIDVSRKLFAHLADQTWRSVCSKIDSEGMNLLLNVIDPTAKSTESEAQDDAEDQEMADSVDSENDSEDKSLSSDSDDDDDQDNMEIVDEQLKLELQSKLADAIDNNLRDDDEDGGEDEEELLDDDQMISMGFDAKLAEIFRSRNGEKKQRDLVVQRTRSFKIKVLELLEIWLKQSHRVTSEEGWTVCLELLQKLVRIAAVYGNTLAFAQNAQKIMKESGDKASDLKDCIEQVGEINAIFAPEQRTQFSSRVASIVGKAASMKVDQASLKKLNAKSSTVQDGAKQLFKFCAELMAAQTEDVYLSLSGIRAELYANLADLSIWSLKVACAGSSEMDQELQQLVSDVLVPHLSHNVRGKHIAKILQHEICSKNIENEKVQKLKELKGNIKKSELKAMLKSSDQGADQKKVPKTDKKQKKKQVKTSS
ncbi:hypothetical protein MIR68_003231 [Amoeboaphelidium protococcarum]|nr:hypothetical protein MIR68_003231 [Amoeboaphelidium protococcarum]